MRSFVTASIAIAIAAAAFVGPAAQAEQYKDYTPQKGAWSIQAIEVDPNHIDDYLTGIRKSLIVGFDLIKKRGMIDDYWVMTRMGYVKDSPTVLIGVHYPSLATLEPDKARDEALNKEVFAVFSKEMGEKAVKGYETYRKFIDDALYNVVDFAK
ncbi:hypothetical protein [Sphingomonas profundi]|uniref:hypothetical protein n=1 Tax=Alterirhizorhabdus profundi TaxID=2681549 RepID=UPI0012E75C5C|nr:hypothetical protein [Sphingomonas profundi]